MTGPAPDRPDEMIGRILLGRYRVVRRLAEGGMGVVYLARAEGAAGFLKPVVIKLVLSTFSADRSFIGMFVREAQILAQLRHPGIVDVIEFGEQDGAYVMVLEYVAGYNLGQWARYANARRRGVPTEIAIQIVIGVLDALHHVHTQVLPDGTPLGITHRDVSPSNVLLSSEGYAKLVDFGVARMETDTLFRTEGGGFRGKLAYSAPELFEGAEATPLCDVYSAAVVLHELLIGKNVFAGRAQADTMARVLEHVPESVHGVRDDAPDEIDPILARGLAKSPQERFQSAADLAQALRQTQRASEPELRAQLAQLLREDFGDEMAELLGIESLARRDRAWRRLSMAPPPIGGPAGPARGGLQIEFVSSSSPPTSSSVHEQPTRVLDASPAMRADRDSSRVTDGPPVPKGNVDVVAPATIAAEPGGVERDAVLRDSTRTPPSPSARARWLPWSVAALGIAAAVVALAWNRRNQPPPQRIVLVEHPMAVAGDLHATDPSHRAPAPSPAPASALQAAAAAPPVSAPALAPALPPAPSPAPAPDPAADTPPGAEPTAANADSAAPSSPRTSSSAHAAPNPAALTRAFRRNEKGVQACFTAHGAGLPKGSSVDIHFEVDARGRTQRADVLPEALDATALGACLRKLALATRFPNRGEEVAFRIPVTARRVRVGN